MEDPTKDESPEAASPDRPAEPTGQQFLDVLERIAIALEIPAGVRGHTSQFPKSE